MRGFSKALLLVALTALVGFAHGFISHTSLLPTRGLRSDCMMSGQQQFKGFGKEAPKKGDGKPVGSSDSGTSVSKEDVEAMIGEGGLESLPPMEASEKPARKQLVNKGARADPVNLDGSAMLDVGWVKQSFDTVMSEEWKKAGTEERISGSGVCTECGGTGRIQGGLGTLPGLEWWPIKAFRPCPTCEKSGLIYNRRGQVLDEVLFGKTDMPIDYKAQPDNRGLSADDVKKIMQKRSKKPPTDSK